MDSNAVTRLIPELSSEGTLPLQPMIEQVKQIVHCKVSELSYIGYRNNRVTSLLVEPTTGGPFPGLLFLHPSSGDKMTFLDEAKNLANEGFVSLLIDAPFKRPEPYRIVTDATRPETIRDNYLQCIGDIRRGFDLLGQIDSVDPDWLGYVGKNLGAALSGAISSLESRVKAIAFLTGFPQMGQFWQAEPNISASQRRSSISDDAINTWSGAMAEFNVADFNIADLNIVSTVREALTPNWFFQFGVQEDGVPVQEIEALKESVPRGSRFEIYDDGQTLESPQAEGDRRTWLKTIFDLL